MRTSPRATSLKRSARISRIWASCPRAMYNLSAREAGLQANPSRGQSAAGANLNQRLWEQFLLSGLIKCAACHSNYIVVGKDTYGCGTRRTKGNYSNDHRLKRHEIEAKALSGLKEQLTDPGLVDHFIREFNAEVACLNSTSSNDRRGMERHLAPRATSPPLCKRGDRDADSRVAIHQRAPNSIPAFDQRRVAALSAGRSLRRGLFSGDPRARADSVYGLSGSASRWRAGNGVGPRIVIYDRADLEAWVAGQRRRSTSEVNAGRG